MSDAGGFRFVSHARSGLIAEPGVAASGTLQAGAVLSDGSSTTPVTFALPGPGDVLGLDAVLVTRRYPRPGSTDVETEFFPLIEFSVPELPWLLPTPTGPHGPVPWLCLVVVEAKDGVSIRPGGMGAPDVLQIADPAKPGAELPDPADAVLWAHAFTATQVHAPAGADPVEIGTGPPLAGSRLVVARRLRPQTSYIACVVPTLAPTALAGLGGSDADISAALAAPQPNYAWSGSAGSVELPAYIWWEFSCTAVGDFESLARSLGEVPVDDTFGTRHLDLGLAGPGMPGTTTATTVLRGALTAPGVGDEAVWPVANDHDQTAVDTALTAEITAVAKLTATPGAKPVVGPLLYARAAAGRGSVGTAEPATDWFDQLNRDPRARAVAGLGARVLRRNVEEVMAAAWEQVGDVDAANAALRRLQASRAVLTSLHERHVSALSPGRIVSVARPLLSRVTLPPAATGGQRAASALDAVAASALPAGGTWRGVGIELRRTARPAAVEVGADVPGRIVSGLAGGIAEPSVVPDGTVTLAAPSAVLGAAAAASLVDDSLRAAASAAKLTLPADGADAVTLAKGLDSVASSAGNLVSTSAASLARLTAADVTHRALPPKVTLSSVGGVLVRQHPVVIKPPVGPIAGAEHQVLPAFHPLPLAPVAVDLTPADPRLATIRDAFAGAVSRFVRAGTSSALPAPAGLDLRAARTALLANLDPGRTVATLATARVPQLAGLTRKDPVAPVMAGPVFGDAAFLPLVQASHDAFVPGLDSIPVDSVTVVETNPTFIAAYLAGLNSALGHDLLWRGYPTDERGTYWHSFWGAGPEIGPLHLFSGSLPANVNAGAQPLLVLVLRGKLLRRYPDSDIYAVLAGTGADVPELDDASKIVRPLFRDFIEPDFTFVGFPLSYDDVTATGPGKGYWFVIAEHPGQPRFGLTDPDSAITHPPLPSWSEISWADLGPVSASVTYVPSAPPPMAPAGTTRTWGGSAADMAAITYQSAVRVALRASDLLKKKTT
jgi:hypothetical protein